MKSSKETNAKKKRKKEERERNEEEKKMKKQRNTLPISPRNPTLFENKRDQERKQQTQTWIFNCYSSYDLVFYPSPFIPLSPRHYG